MNYFLLERIPFQDLNGNEEESRSRNTKMRGHRKDLSCL
jgi:hypothetical protein